MAGVPEIEVPTVQPEAQPAPESPLPPLGAFAGAQVGAGAEKIGEELWGVGWKSYHMAMEAQAQEKETEFLGRALKVRDEYRGKYNMDAISAHDAYTKELDKIRKEIGNTVSSKYGATLYNNNSLRRQGYVQESIDSWFEQQNRGYQTLQYKQGEAEDTKAIAAFAADTPYRPEKIEDLINARKEKADRFAASHGMDGETREKFATEGTHKLTEALFKMLLDPKGHHDPALIRSELSKYTERGMIDPNIQKDAQHALGATEVKSWAKKVMNGALRYDYDGEPDPEGHVRYADLVKATKEGPNAIADNDPNGEEKREELEKLWTRHFTAQSRIGAELENAVIRQGRADGGRFAIPEDSMDWQKFSRLHPERASGLRDKTDDRIYRNEQRDLKSFKQASSSARGATWLYLDKLTSEDAKEYTPAQVEQLMRDYYHGAGSADPHDVAMAIEHLKKLQDGKLDYLERKFNQIASQALEESYKGNKTKVRAAMNVAHYILEDFHKANPDATESDLRAELVSQFQKKDGPFAGIGMGGFLGSRPGESYVRRPPKNAIKGKDGNYYVPTGKVDEYRKWSP